MASGSTVEKYLKGWTAFNILQLLGEITVFLKLSEFQGKRN